MCPYCNFYKTAASEGGFWKYVEAVLMEAVKYAGQVRAETVFFGGGTPTALSGGQLERLIGGLGEIFDLGGVREFTVEMNPATVSLSKAETLLQMGVTRASLGVQSWEPHVLATLGRVHTGPQAERSIQTLRAAGFKNLNLDLMFGVPGQGFEDWEATLEKTIEIGPQHISAYSLTYEEDTEFFLRLQRGEFQFDALFDAELFGWSWERLEKAGYLGYETSNFARPGFECRHNLAIWRGADYLGLGPGAVSTVGGLRWRNVADVKSYTRRLEEGLAVAGELEEITPEKRFLERLALGLRTRDGVELGGLDSRKLEALCEGGYALVENGRVRLVGEGRALVDEIVADLVT